MKLLCLTVLVMKLEYQKTEVILRLNEVNRTPVLSEAVEHMLDDVERVQIKIMPANVTFVLDLSKDVNLLDRYIYWFFPNILDTSMYGRKSLIDASCVEHSPPTAHVVGVPSIPSFS